MKISKFMRSALAFLLILASLVGVVPVAFAAEEERQQITIHSSDLVTDTVYDSAEDEEQALVDQMTDLLRQEYGVDAIQEQDYGNPEFPCLPEDQGPATKSDNLNTSYVFLDFKIGSDSRDFNWQVYNDGYSSTQAQYTNFHPNGQISATFSSDDPRIFMPVENTTTAAKRLGNYKIQSGDIVQVRIGSITPASGNTLFDSSNTNKVEGYFAIVTDKTIGTSGNDKWQSCGTAVYTKTVDSQILQFKAPSGQVGNKLQLVRFDPFQQLNDASYNFPKATLYIDYIYVGPANKAPVLIRYRNEGSSENLKHKIISTKKTADDGTVSYTERSTYGYVGYGQVAPYYDHGKKNSTNATNNTQTIWGYAVWQDTNKDGTYEDMNKFITDPTGFKCYYDTIFYLKSVTIRTDTLSSKQTPSNPDVTDDKYTLTVDGFDTATLDLGSYGKPVDVTIVLDRSGSESDLASGTQNFTTKSAMTSHLATLDTTKWPGYYRASVWRYKNNKGGSGAKAYVYHMPMRYYNGEWQCWVVPESGVYDGVSGNCNCDGKHADFGVYPYNANGAGMNYCTHCKWVSMSNAYSLYEALMNADGYKIASAPFQIGICRLGIMQNAVQTFVDQLFNSTHNLNSGNRHSISILSFGHSVFIPSYPYNNQDGAIVKTGKNADCSYEREFLDENSYVTFLSQLRNTFVFGQTRTDAAFQLLAGDVSDIETGYNSGRTEPYIKASKYIRTPDTADRKRVVVFLTDGVPTTRTDGKFEYTLANKAIKASKTLKADSKTTVYAIGVMSGADSSTLKINTVRKDDEAIEKMEARYTENQRKNDFMNAISSRCKGANVYWTTVTPKGNYYIASNAAGDKLVSAFETVWNGEAPTVGVSNLSGPGSLWLYEHFSREWKPDPDGTVKIYAEAYKSGGNYSGTRVLIGEHKITNVDTKQSYQGNGYILHIEPGTEQDYACVLQWTDAKTAFLRESDLSTGSKAKSIDGTTLNTKRGYKIYMEMPIEVDRNNTLGGNNIPLTETDSGCYQAKTSADTERGAKLFDYTPPDANVFCTVGGEAHDYFLSLDEYIGIVANQNAAVLENVLGNMARMPKDVNVTNSAGFSNCDYVKFDVKLTSSNNKVVYHKGVANYGDKTLSANVFDFDNTDNTIADFSVDQIFNMTVSMTHKSARVDFFGREPYSNINETLHPTYYVPKFAVVDYGDSVSVPMGLEGKNYSSDSSKISDLNGGTLSGTGDAVTMKLTYDKKLMNSTKTAATYTYTTDNIPKGMTSNEIAREVTLIPANVVAYDDTALTFGSGWSTSGTTTAIEQTYDNTAVYGRDSKYDTTGNFHGSVKVAEVSASSNSKQAQFTFNGTGFEIISKTTKDSGVIIAEVFTGSTVPTTQAEADKTLIKSILCNTYLANGNYSQVPVIRWDCDSDKDGVADYGTYTVRLTAYYNAAFALRGTKNALSEDEVKAMLGYGDEVDFTYIPSDSAEATRAVATSYKVYVDGVRIFNPVEGSTLVNNVYSLAGEIVNAEFVDMQSVALRDTSNWAGGKTDGMLYLADKSASADADDLTSSATDGFPLFMDGKIEIEKVGDRIYYKKDGKRIKDTATGKEIFSMYLNGGYYYMVENPNATAEKPYLYLSRAEVRKLLGDDGVFYSSKYRALGAKCEIQLKSGSGLAFKVTGSKVMVSIKSADGGKVTLQAHDGSDFVNVASNVTSATESFYDVSAYVKNGMLILKNGGSGILSVVHIKTGSAAVTTSEASIYVDDELAYKAAKLFETPIAETVTDELKLSHSLNLRSNISINYVVSKDALEGYDFYEFTAEVAGKTYYLMGEEKGKYVYFTLEGLNASMMNDNVRSQLTAYKGDEVYTSPVDDYSIATYAFTMMNREDATEQFKRVCANLLRYGAATQTYLGYNTDALADEELTEEQRAYLCDLDTVTFGSNYTVGNDVADATVVWQGRTLSLTSTVTVKLVVNVSEYEGNAEDLELRVSYVAANGEEKTFTVAPQVYNADKGQYLFDVDRLNAADLRAVLTCQVFAGDVAVSQTLTYCADTYGNGKTGTLLDLCKALFAYVDEAKAYFG